MVSTSKLPLSESVLRQIRGHVKMHCEAFACDTVYLDTIGIIPGGRIQEESLHWPVREAFKHFQSLGAGRLEGDSFKVLDRDYFNVDTNHVNVSLSFYMDERIRSELLAMLDIYAQVYDVENRLRFFLNQKLSNKYGSEYVSHLPPRVRERIDHEKSRHTCYVIDPRRGELEFCHFSDLRRILLANEEFVAVQQSRSVLLDELDYLNSIRNLAAHNNLIAPTEMARVRNACEVVRLIAGTKFPPNKPRQPSDFQLLQTIDI